MPALAELAPLLTLIALFLLCYLTLQGYRFSVRPLIQGLAWFVSRFAVALPIIGKVGPGPWIARQLRALDRQIMQALAYGIDRSERYIAALWNGSARLMEWVADEVAGLAHDTVGAFERLGAVTLRGLRKVVMRLIAVAVGAAYRQLLKLLGIASRGLGKRIVSAVSSIFHLRKWAQDVIGRTLKQVRALLRKLRTLAWLGAVTSIGALGHLIFRRLHVGWLTRYRSAAALVAVALGKLGLSWLRCNNVAKTGKAICRTDADWLDGLLLGGLAIVGTISVVEMARELQGLEDEAVGILKAGIREL